MGYMCRPHFKVNDFGIVLIHCSSQNAKDIASGSKLFLKINSISFSFLNITRTHTHTPLYSLSPQTVYCTFLHPHSAVNTLSHIYFLGLLLERILSS